MFSFIQQILIEQPLCARRQGNNTRDDLVSKTFLPSGYIICLLLQNS